MFKSFMRTGLNLDSPNAYAHAMRYCPRSAICQDACQSSLPVYLWSPLRFESSKSHILGLFRSSVASADGCKHLGLPGGFSDHNSTFDTCALYVHMLRQDLPKVFVNVYASLLCQCIYGVQVRYASSKLLFFGGGPCCCKAVRGCREALTCRYSAKQRMFRMRPE